MSLQAGIVGLPNVGKSTLFNAIVEGGKAQSANFPFCTIDPNIGIAAVPDERLNILSKISKSQSTIATTIQFVDIAGLVKGASKGEGLGNKFLANIREVDAIVQVVRCFDDVDVTHVNGQINAFSDAETINLELACADLDQIDKRMQKILKNKKRDDKLHVMEIEALEKIKNSIENGKSARSTELEKEELEIIKSLKLLTMKPMIYAANIHESEISTMGLSNEEVKKLKEIAIEEGSECVVISSKLEAELNELDKNEAFEFLESLGAKEGGLSQLINATYKLLGLQTYFTTGEKETKAWTIKKGMTASQAAGIIHTDFEKGFIRAETISYDDFVKNNGYKGCQGAGLLRLEGKDYIVKEGDVLLFRFNV